MKRAAKSKVSVPRRATTAIGDELRDRVIELLEAEGHKVAREVRVGTKKIDVLLQIDEEFRPQTIAIECKNVSKNISQGELNAIYADHSILLESGDLTRVFVVSKLDLSPRPSSTPRKDRGWTRSRSRNSKTACSDSGNTAAKSAT